MDFTIDFETRSKADLKRVGAYKYARHPSTEPLCLGFGRSVSEVQVWHPEFKDLAYKQAQKKVDRTRNDIVATPDPEELFDAIERGEPIWAHNAWFDRQIWDAVMVAVYGWPEIAPEQWRCSAAVAASFALRRKLEHVASDLGCIDTKDMVGHRLTLKMAKPRKPTKGDPDSEWHQKAVDLQSVFEYCAADVRAQIAVVQKLRPLIPAEQECWRMDQEINGTGLYMDRPMIEGALRIGKRAVEAADDELYSITGGDVGKCSQREAFKEWMRAEGVPIPTVLKRVIDKESGEESWEERETTAKQALAPIVAERKHPPHVIRAMEVFLEANKASTKKYQRMIDMMSGGRVRDLLAYHAATTGRWGGRGIQPQNFVRRAPKPAVMEQLAWDLANLDYDDFAMMYGEDKIMSLLSQVLRGTIVAPEGKELLRADMSAVEARGVFWVAGHEVGLKEFRRLDALGKGANEDIYTWQASLILGRPVFKFDEEDRQVWGKVPILGCGYQMWWPKLKTYAGDMGIVITDEQSERIVKKYREDHYPVVELWEELQWAAIKAVRQGKGAKPVICANGKIRMQVMGAFLAIRLPSGRLLHYFRPHLKKVEKNGKLREQVHFLGFATYKPGLWTTCSTYGGKLTENVVQAICRDLMRDGMVRARKAFGPRGFRIVLTVHDEVLGEAPIGAVSFDEFLEVLSVVPEWAEGFPLMWDGWVRRRYGK